MKIKYSVIAGALLLSGSGLFASSAAEIASAYEEARSRISPIVVTLIPNKNLGTCGFKAGEDYNVTIKTMGYEENMRIYGTFYDCQDMDNANRECGRKYDSDEKVVETEWLDVSTVTHEDWAYTDSNGTKIPAYIHTYDAIFTMSDNGKDSSGNTIPWEDNDNGEGGAPVVIRWWQKADDAEGRSVSLLIGTEAVRHYGLNMRRIGAKTTNNLDVTSPTCADE